jgi:hypothetical protein
MEESVKKKVDESWKEQAEREKQGAAASAAPAADAGPAATPGPPPRERREDEFPEARFDLFLSGLAMEAFVALGDLPHPATRKQTLNLPQAKYLIDLLGILEEKTQGRLTTDEERLLKDALYQLRMRYLSKSGSP